MTLDEALAKVRDTLSGSSGMIAVVSPTPYGVALTFQRIFDRNMRVLGTAQARRTIMRRLAEAAIADEVDDKVKVSKTLEPQLREALTLLDYYDAALKVQDWDGCSDAERRYKDLHAKIIEGAARLEKYRGGSPYDYERLRRRASRFDRLAGSNLECITHGKRLSFLAVDAVTAEGVKLSSTHAERDIRLGLRILMRSGEIGEARGQALLDLWKVRASRKK